MASSSSAADNPGKRGRGRPRKDAQAPAALQEAAQDECVDSLLSMIAEAEVPESASKEKNKPEKHNVKKDKKERKVDEDKDKTVKDKKNAKSSKKETEQDTDVCKVQREKKPSLPGNYEWPADPVMEKLTNKTESRWFGANSWGSWRMAFLLARLQHQVWKAAAAKRPSAAEPSSAEPSSAEPSSAVEAEGGAPVEEQVLGQEPWRDFTPKSIDPWHALNSHWPTCVESDFLLAS
eukprot:g27010.t1